MSECEELSAFIWPELSSAQMKEYYNEIKAKKVIFELMIKYPLKTLTQN